jgi:preprotein translocase subunit SecG
MYILVLSVHIILAVTLVGLVLLQQGKGADVGAIVSGSGSNSLFGVGGASSLLVRMTTGVAVAFMLTSVLLVRFGGTKMGAAPASPDAMSGSVFEGEAAVAPTVAPTAEGAVASGTPVAASPGAAPAVVPPAGS